MSNPQFKIYGQERRNLKKELSKLKGQVRMFWYYYNLNADMYKIMGHENPYSKDMAEKDYEKDICEIKKLEKLLSEPYE
jgi:hypothetical protein